MKNNIPKLEMFVAVCKCGHVGREKYIPIPFPIKAESRKDAARIARDMPRVKHHHKDAILNVIKIDLRRYNELKRANNQDNYLHCQNIQDQNAINLSDRLMDEDRSNHYTSRKEENKKSFYCNKKKIRNQKKYMTRYYDFEKISNYNTIEYNDIA